MPDRSHSAFAATVMLAATMWAEASPWTEQHQDAVVRIEVPLQGTPIPQVATGFIVEGAKQQYYVLTASHGLVSTVHPEPSSECKALPPGTRMFLKKKNGREIFGLCAIHLGSDTALVELKPSEPPSAYPRMELNARQPKRHEQLYYGGFPFAIDFVVDRKAEVSVVSWPPEGWTATEASPAKGMSGGPYLEAQGTVLGLHHGQASDAGGWGIFVPISMMKTSLEKYVRPIATGPEPETSSVIPSCSAATISKVFRHVHPSQRLAVYSMLCTPADPIVAELLQYLPYEVPSAQVAAAAPPMFPPFKPAAKAPWMPELPPLPSTAQVAASVRQDLRLSETTCLEESNVSVTHDLLNCHNRGQFLPSPNVGGPNTPFLIVVHSTATASARSAIDALTSNKFQASAHVLIERDGSFVQLVPFNRAAWHAGPGEWAGQKGLNHKSIGIELVNAGRVTQSDNGKFIGFGGSVIPDSDVQLVNGQHWHRYTAEQFAAVVAISKALAKAYKISALVGHCDILPLRKQDPGPLFPTGQIESYVLNVPSRREACQIL